MVANLDSRVILDGQIEVPKKVSTDCGMNSIMDENRPLNEAARAEGGKNLPN